MTKTCPDCNRTLPLSGFTKNAARVDGLSVYCKPCAAERQREWKHNNPEKVRAAKRQYRQSLKESCHV
jgi:hypothetical protein